LTSILVGAKLLLASATYSWLVAFSPLIAMVAVFALVIFCFTVLYIQDERARNKS
jgi:hypothetical protein